MYIIYDESKINSLKTNYMLCYKFLFKKYPILCLITIAIIGIAIFT